MWPSDEKVELLKYRSTTAHELHQRWVKTYNILKNIDSNKKIRFPDKPFHKIEELNSFLEYANNDKMVYDKVTNARAHLNNPLQGVGLWLHALDLKIEAAGRSPAQAAGGSPAQAAGDSSTHVCSDHCVKDFLKTPISYGSFRIRRKPHENGFETAFKFAQDVASEASTPPGQVIIVIAGNPDRPGGATTDVDNENAFKPITGKGGQEESMVMSNFNATKSQQLQQALVQAYTNSGRSIIADLRNDGDTCPSHYRSAVVLKGLFAFQTSNTNIVQAGVVSVSGPNISQPTKFRRRMDNHYDKNADYEASGLNQAEKDSNQKTFSTNLRQSYQSALEAALLVSGNSAVDWTVVLPLLSSGIYGGSNKSKSSFLSKQALEDVLKSDINGVALGQYFKSVILALGPRK